MIRQVASLCSFLLLLFGNSLFAEGLQSLPLDPAMPDSEPLRVKEQRAGSLILEFSVPFLEVEERTLDGEVFQELTLPGGELRGEPGQPGLPSLTRFIAVPDDKGVQVGATVIQSRTFANMRVCPIQSVGEEEPFPAKNGGAE